MDQETKADVKDTQECFGRDSLMHNLLHQMPDQDAPSYYRTKTFLTTTAINPLIAAASPLLSLKSALSDVSEYQNINQLYQNLVHEMNAFVTNAQNRGYRSEFILIARYILCATLDETILNTEWGKDSQWVNRSLLVTFQGEKTGEERFFIILTRLSHEPALHIDLLELIYLCLSLGFEGKYRDVPDGRKQLEQIKDILYQQIRHCRDEPKSLTSLEQDKARNNQHRQTRSSILTLGLKAGLISLVIITSIYFGLTYMFHNVTNPLQNTLKIITAKSFSNATQTNNSTNVME